MTPEDEPTSTDEPAADQTRPAQGEPAQGEPAQDEPAQGDLDQGDAEVPTPDPSTVQVDTSRLDRAQDAIDEAREAVKKVAATDSIDEEATGAGELPAFADATDDAEQPEPPDDDVAPSVDEHANGDAGDDSGGDDDR
jgi:hypothetical protein